MKKLMFLLVVLALLATPTVALAGDGGAETGHYSSGEFHWVQDYTAGDRPAITAKTSMSSTMPPTRGPTC